ncbi:hypothetical protein CLU79DRAFT_697323 [Phycomyces nitens]|nr:hypothetical protein CLU79DRAFT_697323 [Phycomyces nitens]
MSTLSLSSSASASASSHLCTKSLNPEESAELYRPVAGIILKRLPLTTSKKNDIPSETHDISRKPQESLYLVIKKPRKDHAWQFPQGGSEPGETVVEAALRELKEECGSDLKVKVDNKEIVGSYKYRFPKEFILSHIRSSKYVGAKVCLKITRV